MQPPSTPNHTKNKQIVTDVLGVVPSPKAAPALSTSASGSSASGAAGRGPSVHFAEGPGDDAADAAEKESVEQRLERGMRNFSFAEGGEGGEGEERKEPSLGDEEDP